MKVKICGITRTEDVKTCEYNDTDFIGFINIKRSKRFLEISEINDLTSCMKNKNKAVLVIEPADLNEAKYKIKTSGIRNIQLHSLSPENIRKLKENNPLNTPLKIIKAIGISDDIDAQKKREIETLTPICDFLLFDYQIKGKSGGTGRQIPIKLVFKAAEIAANIDKNVKLFLAGGMDVERIKTEGKIIEDIFDYVDVNSGVEDQPGIKNPVKINEFIKTIKKERKTN
ncbi:MAG: N-(5'-phosphoribosyl)anthranilate isomerase [Methanobacterium sp. PtaU1.Bin242]|nr:MAG: N-(5'-phosphoribosyl)anthranilate isomerase [Methanobacterium sp. PtaU1.Bin242]